MKRFSVVAAGVLAVTGLVMLSVSGGGAGATVTTPTVSAVSPQHGPLSGGTLVTITGTNLFGATQVTFGGTPATSFVNRTNTRLEATAPPGSAGAVDVQVTTSAGTSGTGSQDQFTYVTGPTIQGVRPRVGPTTGNNLVAISGAGFDPSCTAVSFNSAPATDVVVLTSTSITAKAPAGAVGTVDVVVTCGGGSTPLDTADQYQYVPPNPVVTSVVFDVGNPGGGETVNISGLRFRRGAQVDFGVTPATNVTFLSSRWLQVTAPPGDPGQVDVTVVTTRGASSIVPQDAYLYSTTAP